MPLRFNLPFLSTSRVAIHGFGCGSAALRKSADKNLPGILRNSVFARRGFTLLEVMIAVVIISMLTFALYRFVQTSLGAVQLSTDLTLERQSVAGLINFVQAELNDIPARGQSLLLGTANKSHDKASDQMQWVCRSGLGMMTTAAPGGDYFVTLAIQPAKDSSDWEIGLRRRPIESMESDYKWLSLLRPAAAMEIRYYDPRLGSWLERWNDQNSRPSLIRMRVWKRTDSVPYEAVLNLPAANLQPQ